MSRQCRALSCHVVSCRFVLSQCHDMSSQFRVSVVFCHAMLCHVVLCCLSGMACRVSVGFCHVVSCCLSVLSVSRQCYISVGSVLRQSQSQCKCACHVTVGLVSCRIRVASVSHRCRVCVVSRQCRVRSCK